MHKHVPQVHAIGLLVVLLHTKNELAVKNEFTYGTKSG
jgi:hypothetical protein